MIKEIKDTETLMNDSCLSCNSKESIRHFKLNENHTPIIALCDRCRKEFIKLLTDNSNEDLKVSIVEEYNLKIGDKVKLNIDALIQDEGFKIDDKVKLKEFEDELFIITEIDYDKEFPIKLHYCVINEDERYLDCELILVEKCK